jgi:ketosteroid isomerase-like protein
VGRAFLLQASEFYALAVLILVGAPACFRWAGAVLSLGTLIAFALSHTVGLFGFTQRGWDSTIMELIDDECVWEIMATSEVFAGAAEVRKLAERSVAARTHTADLHMTFGDHIVTADRMCLEYIHEGIVTENWPASENRPAVGSTFELPICLACRLRDDRFVRVHEYFDLGTVIAGGRNARLYS